jgi:hypothetical protein
MLTFDFSVLVVFVRGVFVLGVLVWNWSCLKLHFRLSMGPSSVAVRVRVCLSMNLDGFIFYFDLDTSVGLSLLSLTSDYTGALLALGGRIFLEHPLLLVTEPLKNDLDFNLVLLMSWNILPFSYPLKSGLGSTRKEFSFAYICLCWGCLEFSKNNRRELRVNED